MKRGAIIFPCRYFPLVCPFLSTTYPTSNRSAKTMRFYFHFGIACLSLADIFFGKLSMVFFLFISTFTRETTDGWIPGISLPSVLSRQRFVSLGMKAKRRRYRPHVIASLACFHNILISTLLTSPSHSRKGLLEGDGGRIRQKTKYQPSGTLVWSSRFHGW